MKNLLLYNYNIDVENIKKIDSQKYYFYIDYNKYYLIEFNRVLKDIEDIYELLKNNINNYHFIIKNKFGQIFTNDNGKNYILLKINIPENNEIDIFDILNNQIIVDNNKYKLQRNNWSNLWSDKIDYLEYQISELSKSHPIIIKSFSYYVGLAENAIEYYNLIDTKNAITKLSQRRIFYPNIALNYYNPLNLVLDYRVREIAEYIKTSFFEGENKIKEIETVVAKNNLNSTELNLLFARLLYPSYYFDTIEKILEHHENDDILIKYTEKCEDYEKFLNQIYHIAAKYAQMIKINWLIK